LPLGLEIVALKTDATTLNQPELIRPASLTKNPFTFSDGPMRTMGEDCSESCRAETFQGSIVLWKLDHFDSQSGKPETSIQGWQNI
jgi:hypothetical protein